MTGLLSLMALGAASGLASANPAAQSASPTAPMAKPDAKVGTSAQAAAAKRVIAKNPVVATVDGHAIHLSDVAHAAQALPPQLQNAPPQQLYPVLLNRLIEERALLVQARKTDIAKQKDVQAAVKHAENRVLETAYLRAQVEPHLTEAAVNAYYKAHYVDQKQPHEVKASQILLKTKVQADKVIAKLNGGAKFAALAAKYNPQSKDGGELGWFTRNDMVKPFADAAFALKPGAYTKTPVQSSFGWHVILSEGKRLKPVPALAEVESTIKRKLAGQWINKTMANARASAKVSMFNPDGTPITQVPAPGDTAPAKASATPTAPK
jgi:peptidyl-prolyl cis-trans isomerase C